VSRREDNKKHKVRAPKKAITWPARQIAINAGEDGSVVEDLGIKLEHVKLDMLGKAKKVMIDKENTMT
jgi:chaperonin GroEL (HSP60 family)